MNRWLAAVFVAGVMLYLPTVRYDFVQDDRAIIVNNPAAHSVGEALRAFDEPYWPRPAEAGLYRPVTILSFAVDWSLAGGRAGWFHLVNALWNALAGVLLVLVLARWLPPPERCWPGLCSSYIPCMSRASPTSYLATSSSLPSRCSRRFSPPVATGGSRRSPVRSSQC